MQMSIPWTVYYTDQTGKHVTKNVYAPGDIYAFSPDEIAGILSLDDSKVRFLTKGHHAAASYGVTG